MQKYEIVLKNKFDSANRMVSYLVFDVQGGDIVFQEGQFVMLETQLMNKPYKRAYSIATSYQSYKKNKEICFYVKKASDSGMSDFLTQKIKIGDEMTMSQAFGNMKDDANLKNYLLISIGSGNAGMKAIYENLVQSGDYNKIYQIFGERFLDNLVPQVSELYSQEYKSTQNVIYISKDEIPQDGIKSGNLVIKKGHVQDGLEDAINYFDDKNIKVFVCGKPDMADEIISKLIDFGLMSENIKVEKY